MVEPTEAVTELDGDAIVEPTETVGIDTANAFELDETLAQGLQAAGDVRPLRTFDPHSTTGPQRHTDPLPQYEAGYDGGYEDGRAV